MATSLSKSPHAGIRTFLAIDLPDEVRARIEQLERELAEHESMLKLVRPALVHITVKFLGSVHEDRLPGIERAAAESAAEIAPFALRLAGCGTFPQGGV